MEDLAGGSPEGSVDVDVERGVHLLDVQLLPLHATRPESRQDRAKVVDIFLKSENTLGSMQ